MCPSQQRSFRALSKHKGKVLPIDFSFDVIPTWMPPSPPISEADCTTTTGGDLFYATLNNYLELYEAKLIPESRLPPLPSNAAALANPLAASGSMRHLGSPAQNRQRRLQQQGLDNNDDTLTKDDASESYPLVPGGDGTLSTKQQRRHLRRQLVAAAAANGGTVPTALKRRLRHKLENGGAPSGRGSATPDNTGSFVRRQSMQKRRKQSGSSVGDENTSGIDASTKTVYDSTMNSTITTGSVPNSQGVDYSSSMSAMDDARVRRHSSAARKQQLKYLSSGPGAPAENRILLLHTSPISLASISSSSGTQTKHLLNTQFRGFAPPDAGGEAPDYEGPLWICEEDYRLLCAVTRESCLTQHLLEKTSTIQLNWDFVVDYVNLLGRQYRSARQCCFRYENIFMRMASIENVPNGNDNESSNNHKQQRYAIYFDSAERIRQITADFQRRAHCVQRAVTYRKQNYQHPVRALRGILGGGPPEESPIRPDRLYCMQKSGSRLPPVHEQKLFELGISGDNAFKYENNIGVEQNMGDATAGPSSSSSTQQQLFLMTPRDVLHSRRKQQRHYYQQQQQQQQQQVNVVGAPTSMNINNNDNNGNGRGGSDPGSGPISRPDSSASSSIVGEVSGSSLGNNGNTASALVQPSASQQQPPQQDITPPAPPSQMTA